MKKRVLWIEDQALTDLHEFAGPLYFNGEYDIVVADDATEGCDQLRTRQFDAVIVDIRLPPGDGREWINLYNQFGEHRIRARLGMHLMKSFLSPGEAMVKVQGIPSWITSSKFGVFTVESAKEIRQDLDSLGIRVYARKGPVILTHTILVDLIREVLAQSGAERGGSET